VSDKPKRKPRRFRFYIRQSLADYIANCQFSEPRCLSNGAPVYICVNRTVNSVPCVHHANDRCGARAEWFGHERIAPAEGAA